MNNFSMTNIRYPTSKEVKKVMKEQEWTSFGVTDRLTKFKEDIESMLRKYQGDLFFVYSLEKGRHWYNSDEWVLSDKKGLKNLMVGEMKENQRGVVPLEAYIRGEQYREDVPLRDISFSEKGLRVKDGIKKGVERVYLPQSAF